LAGAEEKRSQDGFVNVNLPSELDLCLNALVSRDAGMFKHPKKKLVWQAAMQHWLDARPDLNAGVAYLPTQATTSKAGTTGFVQRRIELGADLELGVRRLAAELADHKGRPLALARIIYTALDYYVRNITKAGLSSESSTEQPAESNNDSDPDVASSDDTVTFQMNVSSLDIAQIVHYIKVLAPGRVNFMLTVSLDKGVARQLLTRLNGNEEVRDGLLTSTIIKCLALIGEGA
jgi:hypothetical protein